MVILSPLTGVVGPLPLDFGCGWDGDGYTLGSTNIAGWNVSIFNRKSPSSIRGPHFPASYVCIKEKAKTKRPGVLGSKLPLFPFNRGWSSTQ